MMISMLIMRIRARTAGRIWRNIDKQRKEQHPKLRRQTHLQVLVNVLLCRVVTTWRESINLHVYDIVCALLFVSAKPPTTKMQA